MENGVKKKGSNDGYKSHVKRFAEFLNVTDDARKLSERDRDYKDGYQWSDEERAKLAKRKQAAITNNRVKPKVEGLKGLLIQRATDPKAYPRNRKDEKASHAITDALRYVADDNDLDAIELSVADFLFVEGYGAAIVETEEGMDGHDVVIAIS